MPGSDFGRSSQAIACVRLDLQSDPPVAVHGLYLMAEAIIR